MVVLFVLLRLLGMLFPFSFDSRLQLLPKLSLIWLAKVGISECLHLDGGYLAVSLGHDVVEGSQATVDKKQVKYN